MPTTKQRSLTSEEQRNILTPDQAAAMTDAERTSIRIIRIRNWAIAASIAFETSNNVEGIKWLDHMTREIDALRQEKARK